MDVETNLQVLSAFTLEGSVLSCERYGEGHINETYKVVCDSGRWYILQKLSTSAFKRPDQLMENVIGVTAFLQSRLDDPRGALNLIPTVAGAFSYVNSEGAYYRLYDFVTDSYTLQPPSTAQDFYESAVAFGNFQRLLADYPAETLYETIVDFHNTPARYRNLHAAIEADKMGRVKNCQHEIDGYLKREADGSVLMDMLARGELPLKVTHNDTKINNVMMDIHTNKGLCVIDLDTVMPGLASFDFGDSIRFGASTASEDETDLSKVTMSLDLFRTFTEGFLTACGDALTAKEIETLPWGAKLMTLECGARFLTDYLDGDNYFRIHREHHNLDRARTQLKLVEDMEQKWEQMDEIIAQVTAKTCTCL